MRSPQGASAGLLGALRRGQIKAVTSIGLALEYEAICREAEHRIAADLTMQEVEMFIDTVIACMTPIKTHFLWRPQLRDPADEMVLETAINGRASAIVTFNNRDFGNIPQKFGVEVITPAQALRKIKT